MLWVFFGWLTVLGWVFYGVSGCGLFGVGLLFVWVLDCVELFVFEFAFVVSGTCVECFVGGWVLI